MTWGADASAVEQLRAYLAEIPDKEKREAALALVNKFSARPSYFGYGPPPLPPS